MDEPGLWDYFPLPAGADLKTASGQQLPLAEREGEHAHFVFVEDVSDIPNPEALEAPNGQTVRATHPVFENRAVRFRTSGPEARTFLAMMEDFEELEDGNVSDEQREKRKEQLLGFFSEAFIPIIDIYVSRYDDDYKAIRHTLIPGSWLIAVFSDVPEAEVLRPVYYGAPELPPEEQFRSAALRSLLPVAPPVELKLRDIFSLVHISDAELEEGTDEGDEGTSMPLITPPTLGGPGHVIYQEYEEEEEEEKAIEIGMRVSATRLRHQS